jgi:phospholipase A1
MTNTTATEICHRFGTGLLAASLLAASFAARADTLQDCLLEGLETATDTTTVAQLRERCRQQGAGVDEPAAPPAPVAATTDRPSAVERRLQQDFSAQERDFLLTAHRPNFLLPLAYNSKPNDKPFTDIDPAAPELDNAEVQFQVSIKFPLVRQLWGDNDLLMAYTARSWWQFYNDDDQVSEAFRETNYEPEVFLRHYGGPELLGGRIAGFDVGINHQSNGRGEALSRSWNRVMGQTVLDYGDLAVALRAWYRIPEDDEDDDNPKMHRYLGYGDVRTVWAPNRNTFSFMLRPGTEEFAYELTWSYPISEWLRVYALYFNGFGESLLDYDQRVERVGIGFALTDYLMR